MLRTAFLLGLLTAIFLAIGFYFAGVYGMLVGLAMAFLINFTSYWYSDKIVLSMYRAKPLSEKDFPTIHESLKKLAEKAGIPKPKLFLVDMPIPNAFATGRNPKNSAVAITKGLLNLSKDEIEGVIAHEISHIKHRDTLISTMAATIAGALSWLAYIFYFGSDERNAFSFILLFILAPLAATIIRLAISRNREFFADKEGAEISDPLSLANALEKISMYAKKFRIQGNPSTSHLFIVNPFSSGTLVKLFSTHPPVEERIARLRKMAV